MKKLGEDVRLRVFSVFVAIILWIYVVNIQNPEIKREFDSIPVNIENVDLLSGYGLVLSGDKTENISVKLKGNQDAVKKIERNDIEASADLKEIKGKINSGKISIPVRIALLSSEGVEILDKDKYNINIELDKYSQVQKTVEVVFQGVINKNLKYEAKSVRPNVVTISGPKKIISGIDTVKVFVDVTNNEKEMSVVKRFKILTNNNTDITNNEHLIKDSQNIQVDIDYQKAKEVSIVPEIVGEPLKGYYIAGFKTNPEKIIISGHSEKINPINYLNTKKINVTGKDSSIGSSLMLVIPEGISTNFTGNVKAHIAIEKEDTKTIEVSESDISFINTSEEYEYKIINPKLRAYFAGRQGSLNSAISSNLGLFIDVSGLAQGEHQLSVQKTKNENFRLLSKTQSVKIMISRKP